MGKSKHTSTAWEVWPSLYEGFAAAVVHNVEPLRTVAEVRDYREALLLAAAPDLLEALKEAEEEVRRCGLDCVDTDERSEALLSKIRAAIAKAEGK